MVLVDLSKAYDRVWRMGLWWKCVKHFGLTPKELRVLKEAYSNATGRVRVRGRLSEPYQIEQGVKQGNILSPLLFCIFINDLLQELKEAVPGVTLTWFPS